MNYWIIPQYSSFIIAPFASLSTLPEAEVIAEAAQNKVQVQQYETKKVQLNIYRQDLLKAGYNHKRNSWTEKEDKKLLELAKTENLNWNQIGKKMQNRNSKMCYSRYRRLCYETKKRWTTKEQVTILQSIKKQGFNWKKIAQLVPGRTARQIQQHYHFCLRSDINKSQWTLQQDLLLVELLENHGTNWRLLEQNIKGRSQNQIKNRYFGRLLKIASEKQKNLTEKQKPKTLQQ